MKKTAIPVSRRALLARISRRLAKDGKALRANRARDHRAEPDFWVVDDGMNAVVDSFDEKDIESFARELDALAPFEKLAKGVVEP